MAEQAKIDQLRQDSVALQKLSVDGTWQAGAGAPVDVVSLIDGSVLMTLSGASAGDVQAAVRGRAACYDGRRPRAAPAACKKVLHVIADRIKAEVLALANGTDFGFAAGVWTADLSRAHRMVAGIRAGVIHINTYGGADNKVPQGGVGQSGNGHDKALRALDKCLDRKTVWIRL